MALSNMVGLSPATYLLSSCHRNLIDRVIRTAHSLACDEERMQEKGAPHESSSGDDLGMRVVNDVSLVAHLARRAALVAWDEYETSVSAIADKGKGLTWGGFENVPVPSATTASWPSPPTALCPRITTPARTVLLHHKAWTDSVGVGCCVGVKKVRTIGVGWACRVWGEAQTAAAPLGRSFLLHLLLHLSSPSLFFTPFSFSSFMNFLFYNRDATDGLGGGPLLAGAGPCGHPLLRRAGTVVV